MVARAYNTPEIPVSTDSIRIAFGAAKQKLYSLGLDKKSVNALIRDYRLALALPDDINNSEWQNVVTILEAHYDFAQDRVEAATLKFKNIIAYYHKRNYINKEAVSWSLLASQTPVYHVNEQIAYYRRALSLYTSTHNKIGMIAARENIAVCHFNDSDIPRARDEMLAVLNDYKTAGYRNLNSTYLMLAEIYRKLGNTYRRLFYELEAVKCLQNKRDTSNTDFDFFPYFGVGITYADLGEYASSLEWYKKTPFFNQQRPDFTNYYAYLPTVVNSLRGAGRSAEAIIFIRKCIITSPPKNKLDQTYVYQAYGDCYLTLRNYPAAENNYLQVLHLRRTLNQSDSYLYSCYRTLLNLYVTSRQFNKALFYANKLNVVFESALRPDQLATIELNRFMIDSAFHKTNAAMVHFRRYTALKDSLLNTIKSQQIAELQIKFETANKEQSIKLLKAQAQSQLIQVQKANLQRNLTFGGIAIIFIIAGIIYRGYLQKKQVNFTLERKQQKIDQQNDHLQHLLKEKDWLIKEVHHRVKNNLQIVMSLLSSQSAFLKNDAALEAITESQNRVHAIALIHQKLYSTGSDVTVIDIRSYAYDLINNLRESLDTTGRHIRFEKLIEPINLDISQAVPIGLILNEAITNAIKYAFDETGGQIIVALQLIDNDTVLMNIVDNGKGLPADFKIDACTSLGMEIMKVLTMQLGGAFNIKSNSGVTITIEFQLERSDTYEKS